MPVGESVAIRGRGRSHAGRAEIRNIGVQDCGIQIHPASVKFGTGSRVRVSDPPVPRNYERVKILNLIRDTGWQLKVSGSRVD